MNTAPEFLAVSFVLRRSGELERADSEGERAYRLLSASATLTSMESAVPVTPESTVEQLDRTVAELIGEKSREAGVIQRRWENRVAPEPMPEGIEIRSIQGRIEKLVTKLKRAVVIAMVGLAAVSTTREEDEASFRHMRDTTFESPNPNVVEVGPLLEVGWIAGLPEEGTIREIQDDGGVWELSRDDSRTETLEAYDRMRAETAAVFLDAAKLAQLGGMPVDPTPEGLQLLVQKLAEEDTPESEAFRKMTEDLMVRLEDIEERYEEPLDPLLRIGESVYGFAAEMEREHPDAQKIKEARLAIVAAMSHAGIRATFTASSGEVLTQDIDKTR